MLRDITKTVNNQTHMHGDSHLLLSFAFAQKDAGTAFISWFILMYNNNNKKKSPVLNSICVALTIAAELILFLSRETKVFI